MKKTIAALLCLIMLVCLLPLAAAEEAAFEPVPAFMDLFKLDYEITDPVYSNFLENKYVSEDGTIEKWYCSYLPTIDGLKRTEETRRCDLVMEEPCDIQEEHAHLYYEDKEKYYLFPFYGEMPVEINKGFSFTKTRIITQVAPEALHYMKEYNLYRVSDNIVFYMIDAEAVQSGRFAAILYFKPEGFRDNTIVLTPFLLTDTAIGYCEDLNGLLLDPWFNGITDIDEWKQNLTASNTTYFFKDIHRNYWNSNGELLMKDPLSN